MTAAELRTVEAGELDAWVSAMGVGFLMPVAEGYARYVAEDIDLGRTWGAFDGDAVVATLRSFPTELTVPGPSVVRAAALTNVTVAPTHRRRGLLAAMIGADLRASAERGEPVGILIASEYPIYGRFGYGAAVFGAAYTVDLATTRFRGPRRGGEVELVDAEVMRAVAPLVYEAVREVQPGAIERDHRWWDRTLRRVEVPGDEPFDGYHVLYRDEEGEAQGYARYTARQRWDHMRKSGQLEVAELMAATPAAYERLWRHCCEVDLVTSVHAGDRRVDEPLAWLLEDGRALRCTGTYDFVWVRLLDAAAALAARRYRAPGRIVLEVVDALGLCPGRVALEAGPDGAGCVATTEEADLTMPVATLGSLYAGGVSARVLAAAGLVDEHRTGALEQCDVMFRSAPSPWCNTWF